MTAQIPRNTTVLESRVFWNTQTTGRWAKFKAEDDAQKERVDARDQLEKFCDRVKKMVGEPLEDKIGVDDKAAVAKAAADVLSGSTRTRQRRRRSLTRRRRMTRGMLRLLGNVLTETLRWRSSRRARLMEV